MKDYEKELLRIVVDEFVETALPVGSQSVVDRYDMGVSPATIRNWFADLEARGYLEQPHTSGGRIPTERGFRLYVRLFVEPARAGKRDEAALKKAADLDRSSGSNIKHTAKALADRSGLAVIAGMDSDDIFYTGLAQLFQEPEFKNWQRVVSLSETLDRLDSTLHDFCETPYTEPTVLLGRECPFGSDCGTVLLSQDGTVFGLLGPMRMDYQRALSLLESIHLLSL